MMKYEEQNDDHGDRHAEQPQQNSASHRVTPFFLSRLEQSTRHRSVRCGRRRFTPPTNGKLAIQSRDRSISAGGHTLEALRHAPPLPSSVPQGLANYSCLAAKLETE
jgi:hypothetical protein